MAYNATLDIDQQKDLRVVDFSYNLRRDIDSTGTATGAVVGGVIQITVESTSKTDILQWLTTGKLVDGAIKIEDAQNPGSNMKEIKFTKAFIVDYSESFHWQGSENIMQSFTISAKELEINGAKHLNKWPS